MKTALTVRVRHLVARGDRSAYRYSDITEICWVQAANEVFYHQRSFERYASRHIQLV